mgnify:CR=1 FL=1
MGNYDNGIVKVDQELLKPLNSRKVQMVGGLVKKQDIRISEKGLCKKNLDLHASCKVSHLRIVEFRVNSKTVQKQRQTLLPIRSFLQIRPPARWRGFRPHR